MVIQNPKSKIQNQKIAGVCLGLAILLWCGSIPLKVMFFAFLVGVCSFLEGIIFGLSLAFITRTRKPFWIYAWLLVAIYMVRLIVINFPFPIAAYTQIIPEHPDWIANYFDVLRPMMFLFGIPFPFAQFGYHAADPILIASEISEKQEEQEELDNDTN